LIKDKGAAKPPRTQRYAPRGGVEFPQKFFLARDLAFLAPWRPLVRAAFINGLLVPPGRSLARLLPPLRRRLRRSGTRFVFSGLRPEPQSRSRGFASTARRVEIRQDFGRAVLDVFWRLALSSESCHLWLHFRVLSNSMGDEVLAPLRVLSSHGARKNSPAQLDCFQRLSVHTKFPFFVTCSRVNVVP
jgi:hypothetical protein